MNSALVGISIFACTLAGALIGMWLHAALPAAHLNTESRDTVKLCVGLVASITALVLGLVTASSKSHYDTVNAAVKHAAVDILTLDRLLARYGPETRPIREDLQKLVARRTDMIWPPDSSRPARFDPKDLALEIESLPNTIRALAPRDDSQRSLQARALDLAEALLQIRWLKSEEGKTSVPLTFLVILGFWLTVTFTIFGLLSPGNAMVRTVFLVCALSVSSALFLILEMDAPLSGLIKVSAEPMRHALANINQ